MSSGGAERLDARHDQVNPLIRVEHTTSDERRPRALQRNLGVGRRCAVLTVCVRDRIAQPWQVAHRHTVTNDHHSELQRHRTLHTARQSYFDEFRTGCVAAAVLFAGAIFAATVLPAATLAASPLDR